MKSTVFLFLICWSCSAGAGDWPQWLGPTRNNRVSLKEPVPEKIPAEPKPLWQIKIGGGFSSPVVAGNKVVYSDENGEKEILHLLDATTGKESWQTVVADRYEDEWGAGPRSTPFIEGNRVFVQSCNGEFRCLDLANGKLVWSVNFEKDFGVKFVGSKGGEGTAARRGNNGSGLVHGDTVIVPVGSTKGASLVCFDKSTGKVFWKSGNEEAAYSSLQVASFGGVEQVIALMADSLMGIDCKTGKGLWQVPLKTGAKRHAATPVISGENVIVNSHTFGMVAFKIVKLENLFSATELWRNKQMKINVATPALINGFLYSQGPAKNFVCINANTGELKWSQAGFGRENSSVVVLRDKLLILTDDGELVFIAASPEKYNELGRTQICGKNWNFPAYASGKYYVRDARQLSCYELGNN